MLQSFDAFGELLLARFALSEECELAGVSLHDERVRGGGSDGEGLDDDGDAMMGAVEHPPLTALPLSARGQAPSWERLSWHCRQLVDLGLVRQVRVDLLSAVMAFVERELRQRATLVLVHGSVPSKPAKEDLATAREAIEAAEASALLLSAQGVSPQVASEGAILCLLDFVRFQMEQNVFPLYEERFRDLPSRKQKAKSPSGKPPKWSDLQRTLNFASTRICAIFRRFSALVASRKLPTSAMAALESLSFSALSLGRAASYQLAAVEVLATMFSAHEASRLSIVRNLVDALDHIDGSRKLPRAYKLGLSATHQPTNPRIEIQAVSALALHLVQCLPADSYQQAPSDASAASRRQQLTRFSDAVLPAYKQSVDVARKLCSLLLQRTMSRPKIDAATRDVFMGVVHDLLSVLMWPEWPAAEVLLYTLATQLSHCLVDKKQTVSSSFRMLGVQVLGALCAAIQKHKDSAANAMRFRPRYNLEAREGDMLAEKQAKGEHTTACICGTQSTDNQFSQWIDCSDCHYWYHFVCVGVGEFVPEKWYCPSCLLRRQIENELVHLRERRRRALDGSRASALVNGGNDGEDGEDDEDDEDLDNDPEARARHALEKHREAVAEFSKNDELAVPTQVLRHMMCSYLNQRAAAGDVSAVSARQFILAQWLDTECKGLEDLPAGMDVDEDDSQGSSSEPSAAADGAPILRLEAHEADFFHDEWTAADAAPSALTSPVKASRRGSTPGTPATPATPANGWDQASTSPDTVPASAVLRISQHLSQSRRLLDSMQVLLRLMLRAVGEAQPAVRSKTLKALSTVLQAKPELLGDPAVRSVVDGRCADKSISVREAAVDVVGTHILLQPQLLGEYWATLEGRIRDTGVSVRKRVVNVFRSLILRPGAMRDAVELLQGGNEEATNDTLRFMDMLACLAERAHDDRSVQKLVHKTIAESWFPASAPEASEPAQPMDVDDDRMSDEEGDDDEEDADALPKHDSWETVRAHTVVAVIHRLQRRNVSAESAVGPLVALLRFLLGLQAASDAEISKQDVSPDDDADDEDSEEEEGDEDAKPKKRKGSKKGKKKKKKQRGLVPFSPHVRPGCVSVCTEVAELLLQLEEEEDDGSDEATKRKAKRRFQLVRALHTMARVDPSLLAEHVSVLVRYLDREYPEDVLRMVCELVMWTVPLMEAPPRQTLTRIEDGLLSLILAANIPVVKLAMAALCTVVDKASFSYDKVLRLFRSFTNVLIQLRARMAQSDSQKRVLRPLIGVTLLLKYFDVTKYLRTVGGDATAETVLPVMSKLKVPKPQYGADPISNVVFYLCYSLAVQPFPRVQRCAMQSIVFLFSRCPPLLITAKPLLDKALAGKPLAKNGTGEDEDVVMMRIATLRSLAEFLRTERELTVKNQAEARKSHAEAQADRVAREAAAAAAAAASPSPEVDMQSRESENSHADEYVAGSMRDILPLALNSFTMASSTGRKHALSLVTLLVKQGLVNPQKCVSPMISLLADPEPELAKTAHRELQAISRKHSSLLERRVIPGITKAFRVRSQLDKRGFDPFKPIGQLVGRSTTGSTFGLSVLYRAISKTQRRAALSMVDRIASTLLNVTKLNAPLTHDRTQRLTLDLFAFAVLVLAHLPYAFDEPLRVMHTVEKVIVRAGADTEVAIHQAAEAVVQAGDDARAKTKALKTLKALCDKATAVGILVSLKNHFKVRYRLSAEKLEEFNPNAPQKKAVTLREYDRSLLLDLSGVPHERADVAAAPNGKRAAEAAPPVRRTTRKRRKAQDEESGATSPVSDAADKPALESDLVPEVFRQQLAFFERMMSQDTRDLKLKYEKKPRRKRKSSAASAKVQVKRARRKKKVVESESEEEEEESSEEEEEESSSDEEEESSSDDDDDDDEEEEESSSDEEESSSDEESD